MNNETLPLPQDGSNKSSIYFILFPALACAIVIILRLIPSKPRDPREPLVIASKIPYIGHLIGMIVYQAEYLRILASRTTHPIFSLKVLSGEIYVITSPDLVQAVFKNPKAFSFEKISAEASNKVFGLTEHQKEILARGRGENEIGSPLARKVNAAMHHALQTGDALLEMNTRALNCFAGFLDEIGKNDQGKGKDELEVRLSGWIRHTFTLATSAAIFGPDNPIRQDHTLIRCLEDFESQVALLFLNILPSITASAGSRARTKFAEAFKAYYASNHHLTSSPIVKARFEVLTSGGFIPNDLAGFDIGLMMAATLNSIPAVFWLLAHIFSSPSILSKLRAEVEPLITRTDGVATMNVAQLTSHCPLLVSTWQETLRVTAATVATRTVTEDTLLNDTYLLKKGGFIQMACGPMHLSPLIWGDDAASFDAARFTSSSTAPLSSKEKKQRKTGFAPFGGGVVLCPGRYFATTEILGVVATLVAGFEVKSPYGLSLAVPGVKKQDMSVQVRQPVGDLDVCISRREKWEGLKWKYSFGDADVDGQKGNADVEGFLG